jgi:aspartate beta-hydroxylase
MTPTRDGCKTVASCCVSSTDAEGPADPKALNARAVDLLQSGDAARARELLERAVEVEPRNPALWMNLATTWRALGQRAAEARALENVLKLEPRHLLALLKKAELLELEGKQKAAARIYQNALQTIAPGARLPGALREPVSRALESVRRNDAAIAAHIDAQVNAVRAAHPARERDRAEHGIQAFLGQRRIFNPQPTFLQIPKLPAWEFHAREDFPWLSEFEAATAEIREECERVLREDAGLVPYIDYAEGLPIDQWAELNKSRRWSAYFLWRDGVRVDAHADRCPKTAALLARTPVADVPGYAPTAFFSILDAKSHIPPHTGVTNSRLIVHLPLVVPPHCRFRVGSEIREWHEGAAWVFDDTIEHEAWNDSDLPRAILIFDTWHPALTRAERELIRAAVPAIKDYYRDEVPILGSEQ